jgi:hypothetical protein
MGTVVTPQESSIGAMATETPPVSRTIVTAGVTVTMLFWTATRALVTEAEISRLDVSIEPSPSSLSMSVVRRTEGRAVQCSPAVGLTRPARAIT